ncbi:MAG: hypothetical protein QF515_14040 [Pseudomonadales bacterium]|jgi:uncharacterized membrane protein|nr:hypothetical protein [Pseudomonadales bacterium]MDP6472418.1 hypothetical protein [Pseudomonadales bacterium]MDP6828214.1 hypothetical protein [Pseudomonadales bacterium]|tara:strand:+ start:3087 stop:3518 length:432 start_codon:yes stop_codon:yes gene_type:complete
MNIYNALGAIHLVMALLLFSLAIVSILLSVLIAVKPARDPANIRLVRSVNMIGLLEQLSLLVVTITGVIAALMNSWSLLQSWLWMSLLIVAFYGAAGQFVTKPARLAVAEGGSMIKVGMQVALQVGHVLLLIVAFALMYLRPL